MNMNSFIYVPRNIYHQLPLCRKGEYVETTSKYINWYGTLVVPASWTVSAVPAESGYATVIYKIPKNLVPSIRWNDSDYMEKIRSAYEQYVWHFQKYSPTGIENVANHIKHEILLRKQSVDKYGGRYISRYYLSRKNFKSVYPYYCIPKSFFANFGSRNRMFIDKHGSSSIEINGTAAAIDLKNSSFLYRRLEPLDGFIEYENYSISYFDDGAPDDPNVETGIHTSILLK